MSRLEDLTNALHTLITELSGRLKGLPDHPWIPGGEPMDGELMRALTHAERVLDPRPTRYPEHDKLMLISDDTHAAASFMEWLAGHGLVVCRYDEIGGEYMPTSRSLDDLLADWADLDRAKLEREKADMLDAMREANGSTR